MTDEELDRIEARCNAATAGPWKDGEFIVAAREDIPALLAEVRRLRAELDDLEAAYRRDVARADQAARDSNAEAKYWETEAYWAKQ
jgi:hypothetical protein